MIREILIGIILWIVIGFLAYALGHFVWKKINGESDFIESLGFGIMILLMFVVFLIVSYVLGKLVLIYF